MVRGAALGVGTAVLAVVACGGSGGADAGSHEASVTDAAPPRDAIIWPDAYSTYGQCSTSQPDCPPEHPYCGWTGCLECGGPYCVDECLEPFVVCVETPPSDAGSCESSDGGPSCPPEHPYCCHNSGPRVCVERELAGWECVATP